MVAASAHALVTGRKVAGLYDHSAGRHLRIAAEARGRSLMGFDGGRQARFGGTLPDLGDAGRPPTVWMELTGGEGRGFDRASSTHFAVKVSERTVQLFDHSRGEWFAFAVQIA
jgi:hypothetical protein